MLTHLDQFIVAIADETSQLVSRETSNPLIRTIFLDLLWQEINASEFCSGKSDSFDIQCLEGKVGEEDF